MTLRVVCPSCPSAYFVNTGVLTGMGPCARCKQVGSGGVTRRMGFVLRASGVLGAVLLLLFVGVGCGTPPTAGPPERKGVVQPSGPAAAPSTAAPNPGTLVIPKSHPRLWWTPERLAQARAWYARNPFTPKKEDVLANAICYVLSRNKRYGQ